KLFFIVRCNQYGVASGPVASEDIGKELVTDDRGFLGACTHQRHSPEKRRTPGLGDPCHSFDTEFSSKALHPAASSVRDDADVHPSILGLLQPLFRLLA